MSQVYSAYKALPIPDVQYDIVFRDDEATSPRSHDGQHLSASDQEGGGTCNGDDEADEVLTGVRTKAKFLRDRMDAREEELRLAKAALLLKFIPLFAKHVPLLPKCIQYPLENIPPVSKCIPLFGAAGADAEV